MNPDKTPLNIVFRTLDFIAVFLSSYLAYHLRFSTFDIPIQFLYVSFIGALLFQILLSFKNVYSSLRGHYGFELFKKLLISWTITGLILLSLLSVTQTSDNFSRLWLAYWWIGTLIFTSISRVVIYLLIARQRKNGHNLSKVIIIGDDVTTHKISNKLLKSPWYGFTPYKKIDFIEIENTKNLIDLFSEANEIWIACPISEGKRMNSILFQMRNLTQEIRFIPEITDLRLLNHKTSNIAGLQTLDLSVSPLDQGINAPLKRVFDIIFSLIVLLIISPIMLLIAALIKIGSPGPAIFKQNRNGIHGKTISVYKFRSMHLHKEKSNITQAKKNDTRITPLGSFLRRSSLDELPQFINVLQGKMSVVGPRPHAILHNEEYRELIDSYMRRHKVKPGITGWAQINGYRGETDTLGKMEKRVEFDLFYIDNWSLWLDIKIVILTIFKGFFSKNAY